MVRCRAAAKRNFSVVFGRGGPIVGDIRRVDLVNLCEELCWLSDITELVSYALIHLFKL